MKITSNERKLINKILAKYNGYHYLSELQKLWKELDEIGVEVMIHNRTDWREYEWESKDTYTMDGEEVDNSLFIFQVYENPNSDKNEYNMYVSVIVIYYNFCYIPLSHPFEIRSETVQKIKKEGTHLNSF